MNRRTALIITGLALALGAVLLLRAPFVWPGYHTGYQPAQPIAFSHRLHSGQMQIPCEYCHSSADSGPEAGIPSADTCLTCHAQVKAVSGSDQPSAEIAKLDAAMADGSPIQWVRVYRLPDHVRFDHSRHVLTGVTCQSCHGPVETMEEVRQHGNLSMGWCINCHRDWERDPPSTYHPLQGAAGPSNDCSACHH
ncbi:MAG: cytochrome c3 family protein [Planctomycetota bacterium]